MKYDQEPAILAGERLTPLTVVGAAAQLMTHEVALGFYGTEASGGFPQAVVQGGSQTETTKPDKGTASGGGGNKPGK